MSQQLRDHRHLDLGTPLRHAPLTLTPSATSGDLPWSAGGASQPFQNADSPPAAIRPPSSPPCSVYRRVLIRPARGRGKRRLACAARVVICDDSAGPPAD